MRRSLRARLALFLLAVPAPFAASGLALLHAEAHHEAQEHALAEAAHHAIPAHHDEGLVASVSAPGDEEHHPHPEVSIAVSARHDASDGLPLFHAVTLSVTTVDRATDHLPQTESPARGRPPDVSSARPRGPPVA